MTAIVILLAGPPMGKERVRVTRTGHAFTPERTVSYEGRLALAAQRVMAGQPLLAGALQVDVVAVLPIPASKPKKWQAAARAGTERPTKKPDWDNFGKILDALNMIVWGDDAQITCGRVQKFYGDKPLLAVRVQPQKVALLPNWVSHEERTVQEEGIFG